MGGLVSLPAVPLVWNPDKNRFEYMRIYSRSRRSQKVPGWYWESQRHRTASDRQEPCKHQEFQKTRDGRGTSVQPWRSPPKPGLPPEARTQEGYISSSKSTPQSSTRTESETRQWRRTLPELQAPRKHQESQKPRDGRGTPMQPWRSQSRPDLTSETRTRERHASSSKSTPRSSTRTDSDTIQRRNDRDLAEAIQLSWNEARLREHSHAQDSHRSSSSSHKRHKSEPSNRHGDLSQLKYAEDLLRRPKHISSPIVTQLQRSKSSPLEKPPHESRTRETPFRKTRHTEHRSRDAQQQHPRRAKDEPDSRSLHKHQSSSQLEQGTRRSGDFKTLREHLPSAYHEPDRRSHVHPARLPSECGYCGQRKSSSSRTEGLSSKRL